MRSSTSLRSKLIATSFKVVECSKSKIFIFLFVFLSDLFYQKAFDENSFTLFSPRTMPGSVFREASLVGCFRLFLRASGIPVASFALCQTSTTGNRHAHVATLSGLSDTSLY